MLVLTIFAMLFLLLIMYVVSRNLLFPPIIFTGVWLITLVGVLLSGDMFYEVRGMAFLVYLVGAIAFSIGGVLGLHLMQGNSNRAQIRLPDTYSRRAIHRFLDIMLIILIAGLPFYWQKVSTVADNVSLDMLLQNIRYKEVEASGEASSFSLINNFGVLAQFLALVMFYETDGSRERRWRAIVAVVLAVVFGGMTGTKGNVVTLLLTLYFISAIKGRRLRVLPLLVTIGLAVGAFAVGLSLTNLVFETFASTADMFSAIGEQILTYWVGGIVAFQRIVENPNDIQSTQQIGRAFLETARSLGMDVQLPPIHADYTMISPYIGTNVYTIYFTYFKDIGLFGAAIIMLVLGWGVTFLYKRAIQGKTIAILFYAMMCAALVESISAEHFILALNAYIKALAFLYVVYRLVPSIEYERLRKWRRHA